MEELFVGVLPGYKAISQPRTKACYFFWKTSKGGNYYLTTAFKTCKTLYLYSMITSPVNIDFKLLSVALKKYIREKARKSNSTILYKKGNQLIEENPKTELTKILKEYTHS
jgi:hypothetical protein